MIKKYVSAKLDALLPRAFCPQTALQVHSFDDITWVGVVLKLVMREMSCLLGIE